MLKNEIIYKINNIPFERFGVAVESSEGVLDHLSVKEPDIISYAGEHGHDADLSARRFEARTITLVCGVSAPCAEALERQIAAFRAAMGKGLFRLEINVFGKVSHHFDLYCKDGFKVRKKWRTGKNFAFFTLTLTEPQPVKKVYSTYSRTASFDFQTDQNITISWGDGSIDKYCNESITHTYTDDVAKHYIIVSGALEEISITTNHQWECSVLS